MESTRLIDVHCHMQMDKYDGDRDEVIRRSLAQGIGMILIGTTLVDSLEGIKIAEAHPDEPVFAAVGIHPVRDVVSNGIHPTDSEAGETHPAQLAALLGSPKVVGIGETGLDYFRLDENDGESRNVQSDLFEQHLLLAKERDRPLIIHVRDRDGVFEAYDNVLTLLRRHQASRFVMHCYSADWAHAEKFLDLGGLLSFTGIITFPKSEAMQEVLKKVPLDRIMVETDAPFLAPEPHRGQRNEPAFVEFVARQTAEVRGLDFAELCKATTDNARRFFRLP